MFVRDKHGILSLNKAQYDISRCAGCDIFGSAESDIILWRPKGVRVEYIKHSSKTNISHFDEVKIYHFDRSRRLLSNINIFIGKSL